MRRTFSVAALMAILGAAVFFAAGPASAQTGYPPTCNNVDIPVDAGSHAVGTTFPVVLAPPCIYTPGSTVAVTVNGTSVGTKIADANGAVTLTVRAVSATELSIDDPVSVATTCGQKNTAVGVGPSAVAGKDVTQSAFFTITCPGTAGPGVVSPGGRVAFTGANIAKWGLIALALVGIGALLVALNRRRTQAGS